MISFFEQLNNYEEQLRLEKELKEKAKDMKITRIPLPKYKIGRHVLNHFEFEQYKYEVLTCQRPGNVKVKCMITGQINLITDSGNVRSKWSGESSTHFTIHAIGYKWQEYLRNKTIVLAPTIQGNF
jgi:hypothetical protein